jgi:hypothetical protein
VVCSCNAVVCSVHWSNYPRKKKTPGPPALTPQQLQQLAQGLEAVLDDSESFDPKPSMNQAFSYMTSLITALLVFVVPQRSQIIKSLRLGSTLCCRENKWFISATEEMTKNRMNLVDYELPQKVGHWLQRYCDTFRPVLLGSKETDTVFLTTAGEARTDIHTCVKAVVKQHLNIEVTPHQFRAIWASAIYNEGTTMNDLQALSRSMLTSTSTLLKHYIRTPPNKDYERAQEQVNSVLGKRARQT